MSLYIRTFGNCFSQFSYFLFSGSLCLLLDFFLPEKLGKRLLFLRVGIV